MQTRAAALRPDRPEAAAAPSDTGPSVRDDLDLATRIAEIAEPRPGPDTPAGPPPAFEITILERERAIQAMLARSEPNPEA